jgi:hypothetical protein
MFCTARSAYSLNRRKKASQARANAKRSPGLHHARRAPVGIIALCPLRRAGLSQGAGSAACSGRPLAPCGSNQVSSRSLLKMGIFQLFAADYRQFRSVYPAIAASHVRLSRYEMYYGRERFRGWVLVSPTMERQNENYLAGVVRTERCNNAV